MSVPHDLLYAPTHEWVRIDGDGGAGSVATVGITAFAVEQLSDLVFIELPEAGTNVTAGTRFGEIESTKTVSDLYPPVSGKVIEVNGAVVEDLDLIKNSPYEDGWLIRIEMVDSDDRDKLLSPAEYEQKIAEEAH